MEMQMEHGILMRMVQSIQSLSAAVIFMREDSLHQLEDRREIELQN